MNKTICANLFRRMALPMIGGSECLIVLEQKVQIFLRKRFAYMSFQDQEGEALKDLQTFFIEKL